MKVKLLDYIGRSVIVDVGDIEFIERMVIDVITGDEILTVTYKDGTDEEYDSSDCRNLDFFDDEYEIYNAATGVTEFDNKDFMNRNASYWRKYKD